MRKNSNKPYQPPKWLTKPLSILLLLLVIIFGSIYTSTLYSFNKQYNKASRTCGLEPVIVVDYNESFSLIGEPASWSKVFSSTNPDYHKVLRAVKNPFSPTKATITKYYCSISDFDDKVWQDENVGKRSKIINTSSNYTPLEQEQFIKHYLPIHPEIKYYEPGYMPPGLVIKSKTIDPKQHQVEYEIGLANSNSNLTISMGLYYISGVHDNTYAAHGSVALPPDTAYYVIDDLSNSFTLPKEEYKKIFDSLNMLSHEEIVKYKLNIIN